MRRVCSSSWVHPISCCVAIFLRKDSAVRGELPSKGLGSLIELFRIPSPEAFLQPPLESLFKNQYKVALSFASFLNLSASPLSPDTLDARKRLPPYSSPLLGTWVIRRQQGISLLLLSPPTSCRHPRDPRPPGARTTPSRSTNRVRAVYSRLFRVV